LIRSLRRAWTDAAIDVLVFVNTAGIVKGNPDIDGIITMSSRPNLAETCKLVWRLFKRYDLAVATQPGDRPTISALLAGRTCAGLTSTDASWRDRVLKPRLFHHVTQMTPEIHRVEQMLRLADALGIARVSEVVCPAGGPVDPTPGDEYAVVHAAPMFRYKQWTRAGWRSLAAGLAQRGLTVVAISGPDEAERRYLEDIWQGVATVRTAAWPETVSLLVGARVYVGPDTSVSHLAAATGCPTVALFGPMDPRVWGPWPVGGLDPPWRASGTVQNRGNVWIVQNPLPCLPCTFEGCERHIDSASRCLEELSASQVLVAVDQALMKARIRKPVS